MTKYLLLMTHATLLAFLLASSHALLKWASIQAHDSYLQMLLAQWKTIFVALSLYGFIFFYYILVLRGSPVSTLYPMYTGMSVLLVLLAGRFLFSEPVSGAQVLGVIFILVGILLMGMNRQGF